MELFSSKEATVIALHQEPQDLSCFKGLAWRDWSLKWMKKNLWRVEGRGVAWTYKLFLEIPGSKYERKEFLGFQEIVCRHLIFKLS